jgi:hypothetical protein
MLDVLAAAALAVTLTAPPPPGRPEPAPLDLTRTTVVDGGTSRVAPEVEQLAGRRVRAVGFMVRMEEPSPAAFWLARWPTDADESGGGTADLPPDAVRVEVPWLPKEVPFVPGPVEVVRTLEVGRKEDALGRVSWIRIVMEPPPHGAGAPSSPPRKRGGRNTTRGEST